MLHYGCIALAALIALVLYFRAKPRPGVPCPDNHWLMGSIPAILKNRHRLFEWHVELAQK